MFRHQPVADLWMMLVNIWYRSPNFAQQMLRWGMYFRFEIAASILRTTVVRRQEGRVDAARVSLSECSTCACPVQTI